MGANGMPAYIGAEAERGVLDIVAGENRDGTLGGERPIEQRLRHVAGRSAHLRISRRAPCAVAVPLGKEHAVWSVRGPMVQTFGQLVWIRTEWMQRAHHQRTVGPA